MFFLLKKSKIHHSLAYSSVINFWEARAILALRAPPKVWVKMSNNWSTSRSKKSDSQSHDGCAMGIFVYVYLHEWLIFIGKCRWIYKSHGSYGSYFSLCSGCLYSLFLWLLGSSILGTGKFQSFCSHGFSLHIRFFKRQLDLAEF